jgi:hypothetical protein
MNNNVAYQKILYKTTIRMSSFLALTSEESLEFICIRMLELLSE